MNLEKSYKTTENASHPILKCLYRSSTWNKKWSNEHINKNSYLL